jgi:hypothetical protein
LRSAWAARLCDMSVLDVVEELVSLLVEALVSPVVPAVLPLLGVPLCMLELLPALDGVVLSVLLPELWATARPTPPASAAATARVVRVFLVAFISILLDRWNKNAGGCQLVSP